MRSSVTIEMKGEIMEPGFKPKVWKLASEFLLGGWITDEKDSVIMRLEGADERIKIFIRKLPAQLFPVYKLREIKIVKRESDRNLDPWSNKGFKILGNPEASQNILPDYAPCPECLAEMRDPNSRRFCYPFWSCAKCGPYYSSMLRSPFVRKNTYLSSFPPCRQCREEYEDKNDPHHYHSELLACPNCGPKLFLLDDSGGLIDDESPVCQARQTIKDGGILALQSLFGGFQLFVDPRNRETLKRLRELKDIPARPIAVMAKDIDVVKKYCICSEAEEQLLKSPAAPIVILEMRTDMENDLPIDLLCPDLPSLGVSLPPTSLISLLFDHEASGDSAEPFDLLAVCSSNWDGTSEGISIDELFCSLAGVADKFLSHDLRIGTDCASSIAVVHNGKPQLQRRARGYTPLALNLRVPLRRIAASFGTDRDNSVALGFGYKIIPSQYIGNIHSETASARLPHILEHLFTLFDVVPDVVACDMDMMLLSSMAAIAFAEKYSLPFIMVQKHHAHALSCMAENGLERALALVFDEGSRGPDGSYWGAELMDAQISSFNRLATFKGMETANENTEQFRPVKQFAERILDSGAELSPEWLKRLNIMPDEIRHERAAVLSHKTGIYSMNHAAERLFDAVAAGLGIAPDIVTYDRQSSTRLSYAGQHYTGTVGKDLLNHFGFNLVDDGSMAFIDWAPMFRSFSDISWVSKGYLPELAMAFHVALANAMTAMVEYGASKSPVRDVVLSGSCFMNQLLSRLIEERLKEKGFHVHTHRQIPMNESGISVGQIYHAGISN